MQLQNLAQEVRREIIDVVSRNGGHLASSLGVVELTLALLRVFDPPGDKIIWDVGHQSYAYKILTGRKEEFATLRTFAGLSGFPKCTESPYDAFGTGHSSTSISAAIGYAKAFAITGQKNAAIAVIGDGAMSAGQAYEALNHAGAGGRCIVVLNDNEMFISENVGAMSSYFNRIRTAPAYTRGKRDMEALFKSVPLIGNSINRLARKAKDTLKFILVPGTLFEEMGFTYLGPIPGHNEAMMEDALRMALQQPGPVLVHVVTTKGQGYEPAKENPDVFHGVGPFDKETGELPVKNGAPEYAKVFGEAMCVLGQADHDIVAVTAAMGNGTGLSGFGLLFPRRYFDVGIAEQHAVTLAAGLAMGGLKPVVSLYSTFYQRAYDQIIHDICLQNAKVVLAVDRAGVVGEDGPTHHGVFDISFLRAIPNLVIMAPKDENELRHMLYTALSLPQPVALRYPRGRGQGVELDEDFRLIPYGRAEMLREGGAVTLVSFGPLVHMLLAAAAELAERGVESGVMNLRYLNPLDTETLLREAVKTGKIITAEDHVLAGGVGSAILEALSDAGVERVRVKRLGYTDYVSHGATPLLHAAAGLTQADVVAAAVELVDGRL